MRFAAIILFILGIAFGLGGLKVASEPSISPLATVLGAFALPTLFIWWGIICWKKADMKK